MNQDLKFLQGEISALCSIFNTTPEHIFWRTRIKRTKIQQYEKLNDQEQFFTVFEYGIQFRVNLHDYLDTGLFLDHRETRRLIASIAKKKRVLNLFAVPVPLVCMQHLLARVTLKALIYLILIQTGVEKISFLILFHYSITILYEQTASEIFRR